MEIKTDSSVTTVSDSTSVSDSVSLDPQIEICADEVNTPKEILDNLFDEGNEAEAVDKAALFTYQPGDPYKQIDNKSDLKVLVLKQIYDSELSVKKRGEGQLVVFYEGEAIIEMRGIDFIQTENGVSPIENWMFT
jgi:hypothetical protein